MNKRGEVGETAALGYLNTKGYTAAAKNYQCRFGEIDLIVTNNAYIVFVEVKSRRKGSISQAVESIDKHKISRIRITAQNYLMKHKTELQPRFDVIIIELFEGSATVTQHIENAF